MRSRIGCTARGCRRAPVPAGRSARPWLRAITSCPVQRHPRRRAPDALRLRRAGPARARASRARACASCARAGPIADDRQRAGGPALHVRRHAATGDLARRRHRAPVRHDAAQPHHVDEAREHAAPRRRSRRARAAATSRRWSPSAGRRSPAARAPALSIIDAGLGEAAQRDQHRCAARRHGLRRRGVAARQVQRRARAKCRSASLIAPDRDLGEPAMCCHSAMSAANAGG